MKRIVTILLLTAMLMVCFSTAALAAGSIYFTAASHVRTGPGSWYDSIGIVNKGSYLTYLGNSHYVSGYTWYNVDFHGQNGWVSSEYAYYTSGGGIATYAEGGEGGSVQGSYSGSFSYGTGVSITGRCNVRSGPSLSDKSRGTAYKGDVLMGTGSISTDSRGIDWYSVQFNGSIGWVSSVYATITGIPYSGGYSGGKSFSGTTVEGTSGDSNVRSGPGLGYKKLGVLYQGDTAAFLGSTSTDSRGVVWYKISWYTGSGWVSSRYTTLY